MTVSRYNSRKIRRTRWDCTLEKWKEVISLIAFTLFFGIITGILIFSYLEEYNLPAATKEQGIVTDKLSKKGLFTPPSYYVRVKLPHGEESRYIHRVSKRQIDELDIGDEINGFTIYGTFSTVRDFIFDSLFFVGAIALFGFFTILGIFVLMMEIPPIERMINQSFLGRPSKGKGYKILTVVMMIFAYFVGRFLLNLWRKIMPIGKTKTEATIIDEKADITFRIHEDSYYAFTLHFENERGELVEVMKEVTRETYNQFSIGEKINIAYRNENPYDVFIHDKSTINMAELVFYYEFIVYAAMVVVMLFTGYALIKMKRKKTE